MVIEQLYVFSIFTLNGLIIGAIFDFFRALRKTFNFNNVFIYIQDILFWIISGISIICFMYIYTDGSIRLFIFIGLSIGVIFYFLSISKFVFKIYYFLLKYFKYLLKYLYIPFKIINKFLKKNIKNLKKNKKVEKI